MRKHSWFALGSPTHPPLVVLTRAMSRPTNNLYQWKTRSEEGAKREVEARLFG
ncbi:MAG TPA: hypothetical protein P5218_00740 [Planctomycetota bacterium]|nr:hypothetical protein [Planctomycetota bacterium]HPF15490.1 hypothetical protein [Planctomycetota bacterium]HRV79924.1 hypothetical protein [Planctomycetota bacterium]